MQIQTRQQDLDLPARDLTTGNHPAHRELAADQAAAYAGEIRALRQRVASLEAELAAAKAASGVETSIGRPAPQRTQADIAPLRSRRAPNASEFTEPLVPAVAAATLDDDRKQSARATTDEAAAVTPLGESASRPGFEQAWTAEEGTASFEERVAERAFFQATTVDEESRSWLLAH